MAVGTGFSSSSLLNWSRPCGMGLGVTVGSSYTQKNQVVRTPHTPPQHCSVQLQRVHALLTSFLRNSAKDGTRRREFTPCSVRPARVGLFTSELFSRNSRHLVELVRDNLKLFFLQINLSFFLPQTFGLHFFIFVIIRFLRLFLHMTILNRGLMNFKQG